MKIFTSILLLFVPLLISAQTVIFSEDFESGLPSDAWELYRAGEEPIQAVPMDQAPIALDGGGSYVGLIHDVDGSYTGTAVALAGDISLKNYTIEADVYCYVNETFSAYTGLAVYGDSSFAGSQAHGIYYKLVADFDADNRFRLYNNQINFMTFQYTYHEAIDATGLYSDDGWYKMKIEVNTVNDSTTTFTCYFDDNMIGTGVYTDDGIDQVDNGKFGLFAFQQDADGIAGYFDNIVVTENITDIETQDKPTPINYRLAQNYPNPFNPTTTIELSLPKTEQVNLTIYNIIGKTIKTLSDGVLTSGNHKILWDATDNSGNPVAAGIYLYKLQTSTWSETKKMILIK